MTSLRTTTVLMIVCYTVGCSSDLPSIDESSGATTSAASGVGGSGGQGDGGAAATSGYGGGGGAVLPLPGYGTLTGDCDKLDPGSLIGMSPGVVLTNAIDFPATPYMLSDLSPGGQVIFNTNNENPNSKDSELMAFEVLHRCELATLLKTESEVSYDDNNPGPITDLLVAIDGFKIGVSVVRAFQFMDEYTLQVALPKVTEKLNDIQASSARVLPGDAWDKQILSVIAEKPENAAVVAEALGQISASVRGDTIVVITVTNGEDTFIY